MAREPLTTKKILMKRPLMPNWATAIISDITLRPNSGQEEQKGCSFPEAPGGFAWTSHWTELGHQPLQFTVAGFLPESHKERVGAVYNQGCTDKAGGGSAQTVWVSLGLYSLPLLICLLKHQNCTIFINVISECLWISGKPSLTLSQHFLGPFYALIVINFRIILASSMIGWEEMDIIYWAPSNPNLLLFPLSSFSHLSLSDYIFIFIRIVCKC